MARLDLPDKWRDEDSVDRPLTSEAQRADKRPLTEPYQMTVQDCIADAEKPQKPRYCYAQCRDPWFQECADCWRSGGNPSLG